MDILSFALGMNAAKGSGGSSGGGSGGGGALEAGVYWKVNEPVLPKGILNKWFTFNNKLHALVKTSSSSDNYDLYEFADGELKTVATELFMWYSGEVFEYNGKVHFIASGYHYVYDGTSLNQLSKVEINGTNYGYNTPFVGNGILYSFTQNTNNGGIIQWDEVSDTWSNTGLVSANVSGYAFYHKGDFYRIYGSRLYKISDGSWIEDKILIPEANAFTNNTACYIDGILYYEYNKKFYKYDFATDTNLYLGYLPVAGSTVFYNCCGEFGCDSSSAKTLLYILNEVT